MQAQPNDAGGGEFERGFRELNRLVAKYNENHAELLRLLGPAFAGDDYRELTRREATRLALLLIPPEMPWQPVVGPLGSIAHEETRP